MSLNALDTFLIFIIMCWAAYRLTRLIVTDQVPLIKIPRTYAKRRLPDGHWFIYLIGCEFCTSVYVAGGITLLVWSFNGLVLPWLVWPAVSGVASYLASKDDVVVEDDEE